MPQDLNVLIVLDGWGYREERRHNGIELAHKPYFDHLWQSYPHSFVDCSGPAVGLPHGIMGNSEVGHMNLGAGRIVYSGLSQIYSAIEDESFFTNPQYLAAIEHVKASGGALHLMGLVSDGAVHSHQDHLYALLELARRHSLQRVWVHCFLDGRDTAPNDGLKFIQQLQVRMKSLGVGQIASLSGRYFAMDRDQRWERVQKAFDVMCGRTKTCTDDVIQYIRQSYQSGVGDEFVEPVLCDRSVQVSHKDAMIFFNFRADRARQISKAFTAQDFDGFDRNGQELPGMFVCTSPYDASLNLPVAFLPQYPNQTLGEVLSQKGLKQLRIAETEKYAHVTFFFNGGRDQVFAGEDRILIPSPKEVPTYDLKPEMSAFQVKDKLVEAIHSGQYQFILCNFANTDMVGHTAKEAAVLKAVETVDACLAEIVPAVLSQGGNVIITADHGNAETLVDGNGEPMTAHTTNLVPFIVVTSNAKSVLLREGGRLCDVAPTLLKLMQLQQPKEMTGVSIVQ